MIRIGLCDDNSITLHNLYSIISNAFNEHTSDFEIFSYLSGILLYNEHINCPFDIIFLDIDMPKVSGFDIAERIREEFSSCFIIFVTSHSDLVYDSMDFQPFYFIRKNCSVPIEVSISQTVKKLMKHMKQNDTVILEDDLSGRRAVYIRDIFYLESDKHYVKYYISASSQPIKMRESITECEEKYAVYNFVRIHKRFLVNLRYLSYFDNNRDEILLGTINQKLPMSRNYKKVVDEKYTLYLRTKV